MKTIVRIAPALLVLLVAVSASWAVTAQTSQTLTLAVNEVAKIGVTIASGSLTIDAPDVGGDAPKTYPTTLGYLDYTSITAENTAGTGLKKRDISAQVTSGTVPDGADLTLYAKAPTYGVGNRGLQAGGVGSAYAVSLAQPATPSGYVAQTILTGMTTGWTTTGNHGAQLNYLLQVGDWSKIHSTSADSDVTVTFTLMESAD
jgi:hypothetical protein